MAEGAVIHNGDESKAFAFRGGAVRLHVVAGFTPGSHMFYHFGFEAISVTICAGCCASFDCIDKSVDDVAKTMSRHWSNAIQRRNDGLHPDKKRASLSALVLQLKPFESRLTAMNSVRSKTRLTLIDQDVFEAVSGKSIGSFPGTSVFSDNVCSSCFCRVRSSKLECCSPAIAIEVSFLVRPPSTIQLPFAKGDMYDRIMKQCRGPRERLRVFAKASASRCVVSNANRCRDAGDGAWKRGRGRNGSKRNDSRACATTRFQLGSAGDSGFGDKAKEQRAGYGKRSQDEAYWGTWRSAVESFYFDTDDHTKLGSRLCSSSQLEC